MKKWILAIAVLALLAPAALAQDDLQALKDKVDAQEKSIAELKKLIGPEQMKGSDSESKDWTDYLKWSGDFRYRYESINDDDTSYDSAGTRHRNRVRARIQLDGKVNDEVDVTVRLASGSSSSPTSTNQTLEGKLSSKDVWLDLMYMTYTPEALTGFEAYAGKMKKPFITGGKNQLIWDADVTFEGLAGTQTFELSEETTLGGTAGFFWLEEEWSTSASDQYLWAVQAYIQQALDEVSKLTFGASYYDFVRVENQTGYASGNSTVGSSPVRLANDFNLLEFFAELNTSLMEMPFSVYGSYVNNTGATGSYPEDTAWLVGAVLNKAKEIGSWQLGYEYRDVEKDAVLGYFTDADPAGGGTTGLSSGGIGSTAHKLCYKYQAMKNLQLVATYFLAEQKTSSVDYDRNVFQFDCVVKFK